MTEKWRTEEGRRGVNNSSTIAGPTCIYYKKLIEPDIKNRANKTFNRLITYCLVVFFYHQWNGFFRVVNSLWPLFGLIKDAWWLPKVFFKEGVYDIIVF